MLHVVFAVPFAMENTLRFARAAAALPGVRLSVVTQDAPEKFPADFRRLLAGMERVKDALVPELLCAGVEALGRSVGPVDRLLGILEPLQEPLALVRERLHIRGMDAPTARNFRDKSRMKDLFAAHDLPCARHQLCGSLQEALTFAQKVGYPLVGKPPAGAGAKATQRCEDEAGLRSFLAQVRPTPDREVLLEEFVQGREFSFDSITLHGQHVFHNISSYHPTPLQVMENPWIQWCVVLPRELAEPEFRDIQRIGPRALSTLGMWTGMSHMEWFRRHDGSIAIGEVAARPPGAQFMTLMSYAHDVDMYAAFAQLMVFETFTPPVRRFACGAAYLRGQVHGAGRTGMGKVTAVHGYEEIRRSLGELIVEAKLPTLGQPAASSYEGEGFIIVRHPDTKVVTAAVQHIIQNLRVELGADQN
jgi:formate-dependent phosphoribosylglycinamide formyltransferase (GAR transformylase)